MSEPEYVVIYCARTGRSVWAVRVADYSPSGVFRKMIWQCASCGARVKVVA